MKFRLLLPALVLLATLPAGAAEPRQLLHELKDRPFDPDVQARVMKQLRDMRGSSIKASDPWVYLALGEANLMAGYRSGSRFDQDSYRPSAIGKAKSLVGRALDLDPEFSQAYALKAHLLILEEEYKRAWKTLNQAHKTDPDGFQPWYMIGVLHRFYRKYDDALKYLNRAEKLAEHQYQKIAVIQQRRRVYKRQDDLERQEETYRQAIKLEPDRAHRYGNYGAFLLHRGRYEEAIENLEKAISIQPYPMAQKHLREAKRKKTETSR